MQGQSLWELLNPLQQISFNIQPMSFRKTATPITLSYFAKYTDDTYEVDEYEGVKLFATVKVAQMQRPDI